MIVVCETSGSVADGEVAWFWRPMVGVKVLMQSRGAQPGCEARHFRTDGVNNSNGPRESAKEAVTPLRGGCRAIPVLPL